MGTTADKLNRLIKTKEGIRQEINRAYGAEEVSTSDTFNSYIQKLEDPFYLLDYIERTIKNIKVSDATTIRRGSFNGCTDLSSVSFPNVTTINDNALHRCTSLSSVSFPNVTTINSSAFRECTSLSSVSFPNATTIKAGSFHSCTSLSSVSFPKLTRIGDNAFRECTSLSSVSFPKLTRIDDGSASWLNKSGAFYNCTKLTTLYIGTEISSVCTLGTGAFQGCTSLTNIYVPANLVDSYKSATNWSNYADKIKAAP